MSRFLLTIVLYMWIGFSIYAQHRIVFMCFSVGAALWLAFDQSIISSVVYAAVALFMYFSGDWLNKHLAEENFDYESRVNKCLRRHRLLVAVSKK